MAGSDVVLRRATATDIAEHPSNFQFPTMIAWVGELDGQIIGLGGFARFNGRWIAFCELSDEARKHRRAIVRAGRTVIDDARRAGHTFIYAKADNAEPMAKRWLESLGFEPDSKTGLFRWQA